MLAPSGRLNTWNRNGGDIDQGDVQPENPSDQAADVQVHYLRGAHDPVLTKTYAVAARQRRTIWVDEEEFPARSGTKPLASTDVSARIDVTNGVPIIVERAMYMSPDDQAFGAGHAAAGVAAPATSWFFAEGSTGSFFDEFLLLANGGAAAAHVTITFTPEGGSPIVRTYTVPPNSRSTVWVDQIPGLESTAVSASVASSVPIVAERALWWPGSGESWREAHVSAGATSTGPRWAVADLELGGPLDANSFVLIYGGGSATVYFDDGTAPVACGSSPGGRFTLHVNGCPGVGGKRFVSVIVEGNASTVVERATYYNSGGELFGAGGGGAGHQDSVAPWLRPRVDRDAHPVGRRAHGPAAVPRQCRGARYGARGVRVEPAIGLEPMTC